ncbi:hypothetical protein AAHE18_01G264600 [Arachis hypogaea]
MLTAEQIHKRTKSIFLFSLFMFLVTTHQSWSQVKNNTVFSRLFQRKGNGKGTNFYSKVPKVIKE